MKWIPLLVALPILLTSCGNDPDPENAPVRDTPPGGKVDLTGISLIITNASIVENKKSKYELRFDYTLVNTSGFNIQFPSIHANINSLVQVNLVDNKGKEVLLARNPLDGLTMTDPRTRRITIGKTTRTYTIPIAPNTLKKDTPINVRVRFHTPSRYDELRTSVEAPIFNLLWPGGEPQKETKKP